MVLGVMGKNTISKKRGEKAKKKRKKKKSSKVKGRKLDFDKPAVEPVVPKIMQEEEEIDQDESINRPIFGELICTNHDDFEESLHHGYNEDDLLTIQDGFFVTSILEKYTLEEILEKREQCVGNHFWTNNEEEVLEYFYDTFNGDFTKLHHLFRWRTTGALHIRYHQVIEKKKENTHNIFERARSLSLGNSVTEFSNTIIKKIKSFTPERCITIPPQTLPGIETPDDDQDQQGEEEETHNFRLAQNIDFEPTEDREVEKEDMLNNIAIVLSLFWFIVFLSFYSTTFSIIIHKIYVNLLIIWAYTLRFAGSPTAKILVF